MKAVGHLGALCYVEGRHRQVSTRGTCGMDYRERITIEPGKRGGKPCVRGTRITVYDVLSYLAAGMTADAVLADFPSLTREDILACLGYAAERERQTLVAGG